MLTQIVNMHKMNITDEIKTLKKQKDAVILAHYYVTGDVQQEADYVGDSFYLAQVAKGVKEKCIVFCGVSFMGESAKILNPQKTVLMPDAKADCPMAHMVTAEKIQKMRERYEDLAVVCYINSTAEIKSFSDVCVTSSNAMKIVKALENKNIFFIPDGNLGNYIKQQVPEKNIICNDGYCPVHHEITVADVNNAKKAHPQAKFLVHPECRAEIIELADFTGSTSEIINYAAKSDCEEFIIGTEMGVKHELEIKATGKMFYPVSENLCCKDMKLITLENLRDALKYGRYEVKVDEAVAQKAYKPLQRMLDMSK